MNSNFLEFVIGERDKCGQVNLVSEEHIGVLRQPLLGKEGGQAVQLARERLAILKQVQV